MFNICLDYSYQFDVNFLGYAREEQQAFSDWLLAIGEGRVPVDPNLGEDVIPLPEDMVKNGDRLMDLIDEIYGHNHNDFSNADFLRGRALLTTTNRVVDEINDVVMDRFPGEVSQFHSFI